MTTMHISLPDARKAFVDAQVSRGGHGSVSGYVRELVRAEQRRQDREALEQKLLAALASRDPIEVASATTEEARQRLRDRAVAREAG